MKFAVSNNFRPTYLCIKEHSITGLRYLCKTTKTYNRMLSYKGSGDYWNNHLKAHGKEFVETPWFCLFEEKEELTKFSLMCSEQWNIVKSDGWANLKPENGIDGAMPGSSPWNKGVFGVIKDSYETRKKKSDALLGIVRGPESPEHKANHSAAMLGKNSGPQSLDHIANKIKAKIGVKHKSHKKHGPQEKVSCPYCKLFGSKSIMMRWHFDNCKLKEIQQ